jgi:hypothetical protein
MSGSDCSTFAEASVDKVVTGFANHSFSEGWLLVKIIKNRTQI